MQVHPIDVRYSDWDATLENVTTELSQQPALRLGLREIRGFREDVARRIKQCRAAQVFRDLEDLCARAQLDARARRQLADAGALRGLAGHRHRARWHVAGIEDSLPLFAGAASNEDAVMLQPPSVAEDVWTDYASIGHSLGPHPVSFVRQQLHARRCRSSREIGTLAAGALVRCAGMVTLRQQPQTASGVTFMTLEDETGTLNAIVWRDVAQRQWRIFREAQFARDRRRHRTRRWGAAFRRAAPARLHAAACATGRAFARFPLGPVHTQRRPRCACAVVGQRVRCRSATAETNLQPILNVLVTLHPYSVGPPGDPGECT